MSIFDMNHEQYAARGLARRLENVAQRLADLAADARRTAGLVESGKVTSYASEISTFQNAMVWGHANCNLGILTDLAADADRGRAQDKADAARGPAEAQDDPSPWANLTDDDKETIRKALAHAGRYTVIGLAHGEARDLFDKITGEEGALASLEADEDELYAQHGSMA